MSSDWRVEAPFNLSAVEISLSPTPVPCELETDSGELLSTTAYVLRLPARADAVKIDTRSTGLIVDGLPFLPMGFYLEYNRWQSGATNFSRVMYEEVMSGMNAPLPYRSGDPSSNDFMDFMDEMSAMSVRVHFNMYGLGMEEPSTSKSERIERYAALVGAHPALLAYYIADEPDGNGKGLDPSWLADTADRLRALDPYHPISLVLNCEQHPYRTIQDYAPHADIMMNDPYCLGLRNPVGCDTCEGHVRDYARRVQLYKANVSEAMPFWIIPQTFGSEQHWDRQPNAREIRAMTYLALVHGAVGVQHFALGAFVRQYNDGLHHEPRESLWAEVRRVALEAADLTPAILSPDEPPATEILRGDGLHARAWREAARGVVTLTVVNERADPQAMAVRVLGALDGNASTTAFLPFEQRSVAVQPDGRIDDIIEGYGTRTYRIATGQPTRRAEPTGSGNLLWNPSFEVQHNLGYPDSFVPYFGRGSSVRPDSRVALDGYYSLRVTNAYPLTEGAVPEAGVDAFRNINAVADDVMRVAVYAWTNAAAPQTVALGVDCAGDEEFTLPANEWVLLEATLVAKETMLCAATLRLVSQGTVWFDMFTVQFD